MPRTSEHSGSSAGILGVRPCREGVRLSSRQGPQDVSLSLCALEEGVKCSCLGKCQAWAEGLGGRLGRGLNPPFEPSRALPTARGTLICRTRRAEVPSLT